MRSDNRVVISDFGLSKVVPDGFPASISLRIEGMPRGRLAYLAPELHLQDRDQISMTCGVGELSTLESLLDWRNGVSAGRDVDDRMKVRFIKLTICIVLDVVVREVILGNGDFAIEVKPQNIQSLVGERG